MEHPFAPDLSEKTADELRTEMYNLRDKLNFALRMQHRPLINQIQMLLESYNNEYNKKMAELLKDQDLNNQINVGNNDQS